MGCVVVVEIGVGIVILIVCLLSEWFGVDVICINVCEVYVCCVDVIGLKGGVLVMLNVFDCVWCGG